MTDIRETMRPDRNVKSPLAKQIATPRGLAAFNTSSGVDKALRANDPDGELLGQTEDFSARSTSAQAESRTVAQGKNLRPPVALGPTVPVVEDPYASMAFMPTTTGSQPGLDIVGAIAAAFVILGPLFLGAISSGHG